MSACFGATNFAKFQVAVSWRIMNYSEEICEGMCEIWKKQFCGTFRKSGKFVEQDKHMEF